MFSIKEFAPVGGNATKAPSVFSYRTNDSEFAVEGVGYFFQVKETLKSGDIILASTSTGNVQFTVSSDTSSVIKTIFVDSYGANITFNSGPIEADANIMDFTGHPKAVGQALFIGANAILTLGFNDTAYQWVGPHDVTIGVGGTYVTVASDYVGLGTADHSILSNLAVGDPHTQYALKTAALAAFVSRGYGGISFNTIVPQTDVNATWRTLVGFDTGMANNPKDVSQVIASNGLSINAEGVWNLNVMATLAHNEQNQSRRIQLRVFNQTSGVAASIPIVFGTGRNTDITTLLIPGGGIDISVGSVGDLFVLQYSSIDDNYNNVNCISAYFWVAHLSEAQNL